MFQKIHYQVSYMATMLLDTVVHNLVKRLKYCNFVAIVAESFVAVAVSDKFGAPVADYLVFVSDAVVIEYETAVEFVVETAVENAV